MLTHVPPDIDPPDPLPLILTWNDINNNNIVADPSDVNEWNTAMVISGTPFTSVDVVGNVVSLYGGSNISLAGVFVGNTEILSVEDQALCVVTIADGMFASSGVTFVSINACTAIPDFCFNQSTSLLVVEINSATSIGNVAFAGTPLFTISAPACTFIDEQAFLDCSLQTASFPVCIEVVSGAFGNCTSMTTCTMPLVEILGLSVFSSCSSLTTFVADNLVDCSGGGQFAGCSALTELSFPTLISSGNGMCTSCANLESFSAPLLVNIGNLASPVSDFFEGCASLTTVYVPLCTQFGGTTGDNEVFLFITGNTITITVPAVLETCDGGNPDGDLVYLAANNTATIIYV